MNERNHTYSHWSPDELLEGAQQGFDLAHTYVSPDAQAIRAEAASVFELAAGEKILAELAAKGITLDQIEQLTPEEVQHMVEPLAPQAMREVRDRLSSLDARAKSSLEDTTYHTLKENGLTQND